MSANILNAAEECARDHQGERAQYASEGDVERCEHGTILFCWHTFACWSDWRALSPFWDRRKYRRALALLGSGAAMSVCQVCGGHGDMCPHCDGRGECRSACCSGAESAAAGPECAEAFCDHDSCAKAQRDWTHAPPWGIAGAESAGEQR